jgi:hypothetical protein
MDAKKIAGHGSDDVAAFMRTLEHPLKAEIQSVLALIRAAAPGIGEGIKWNAPSFRTTEWFATLHLRNRDEVQVILHLGAKARADIRTQIDVDDPGKLLQWLGNDRATAKFRDAADIRARGTAFQALLRRWIEFVR